MERKLGDFQKLFKEIFDLMDNHTVFIALGDHGMTDTGNHGGSDLQEVSTICAAYTKGGFPMKKKIAEMNKEKQVAEVDLKHLDVAPILADLLGLQLPFTSVGVMNPWFHQSTNMTALYQRMLLHVESLATYVAEYCKETDDEFC